MSNAEEFRALHHGEKPLLLPNAWDFVSAAALVAHGFPAIATTSLGVAAAGGVPDGEGLARDETVALAHRLARLGCLFSLDIEAGFSADPAEVGDLAAELAGLGAAGINLEDGRPGGTLADPGRQAELIAAVRSRAPDLFVNARVDTYWLGEGDPGTTLTRAERYLAAGADGIFVPGVADERDIRVFVTEIPAPLNVLFLPGRHTAGRLAELGVRRVSTGSLLFRASVHAAVTAAAAFRDGAPVPADIPSYAEIQRLIGD
ncbi:isocitrate lyase/PEP mutase family protein [Amycolatopsis anabasis]|uniref:isocitrate lyase/PEP mutase family protein n=1 Tax=Amycolatopsis anabasis TaxID=1840409 RepID=UPI00131C47E0|nr:isocitrate lyase/phosphoenolpyruvate mutase family protein [Amycolatopsis anabasis]